jgi:hypothetical protein
MRFVRTSVLLLGLLSGANVYRAYTQSITIDEAFTYNHWVAAPDARTARDSPYNNNLNTWLCVLVDRITPPSEFTLRLPSVLGGLLYFIALFRLCLLLFGNTIWLLLAIAANALNPFVLDYLSAARGYGLALAFLTLGTFYAVRYVDGRELRLGELILAGGMFGLAIDSHITVVFAVAAIQAMTAAMFLRDGPTLRPNALRRLGIQAAATLLVAAPGLWLAFRDLRVDRVDAVEATFWAGLRGLMLPSLLYKNINVLTSRIPGLWLATYRVASWALPCLLLILMIAGAQAVFRGRSTSRIDRLLAFTCATVVVTFALLWIEPAVFRHGYFTGRRLLFTLPLSFVALVLVLRRLGEGSLVERSLAFCGGLALAAMLVNFAADFNTRSYYGWEFDASTAKAASVLAQQMPPDMPAHLGVSGVFAESMDYYRRARRLDWLAPVTGAAPECFYQFYYVLPQEFPRLRELGAQELFRSSGAVLAAAGGADKLPCLPDMAEIGPSVEIHGQGQEKQLLHDIGNPAAGEEWVWTFERPALVFSVSRRPGVKFRMELEVANATLRKTGPVRITFWLNGRLLAKRLYDSPGKYVIEQEVPLELLREDGVAIIETTQDKHYVAKDDGQTLSYLFHAAGFL